MLEKGRKVRDDPKTKRESIYQSSPSWISKTWPLAERNSAFSKPPTMSSQLKECFSTIFPTMRKKLNNGSSLSFRIELFVKIFSRKTLRTF